MRDLLNESARWMATDDIEIAMQFDSSAAMRRQHGDPTGAYGDR